MAIDDLLDEHEQSERVLEWLRTNGAGLIGGIVLGLAAIGGWKWWQQHDLQQDLAAADSYHAAVSAIEANDEQAAAKVAALEDGVFANLSAMELAAAQVDAGEIDKAIVTLRAIKPGNPAVADVVNQRLARLLIATDQADAALASLADASTPSALEVRGDAQQALGRTEQAREDYAQALAALDVAAPQRQLLELKLMEVGGTPTTPEAKS
jgi:predicted negative regulator of RcsB-dependent stress response